MSVRVQLASAGAKASLVPARHAARLAPRTFVALVPLQGQQVGRARHPLSVCGHAFLRPQIAGEGVWRGPALRVQLS